MSKSRTVTRFIVNWVIGIGIAFVLISLLHRWAITSLGNKTLCSSILGIDANSDESIRGEFFGLVAMFGTMIALIDPLISLVRNVDEHRSEP